MPYGRLLVHASTANERSPIQGVRVLAMDNSGQIVADHTTDGAGMTGYMELPAPDPALTFTPQTALQGVGNFNVVATHPNFQQVTIHNVEIIRNMTSYLPVSMHPATNGRAFMGDTPVQNVFIPQRVVPGQSGSQFNAMGLSTGIVATQGGNLNLRSGPGTNYPVVTPVPNGTQLTILGEQNGFYSVRTPEGHEGWVSVDFVRT